MTVTKPEIPPQSDHPLHPLTAEEINRARSILEEQGMVTAATRFAYLGLEEPSPNVVKSYVAGTPTERQVRAFLIDVASGASRDIVVSLTKNQVRRCGVVDPTRDGQLPIIAEDFERIDRIVHEDPRWMEAMARRGLNDTSKIRTCPLTAGSFGLPGEKGRRLTRVLSFLQERPEDLAWAHPVDGVVAYVDLVEGLVLELLDEVQLPVPRRNWDYRDERVRGPQRDPLQPIEIIQPAGSSVREEAYALAWDRWSLRVGFDAREGLILYDIAYDDAGTRRPVLYRASVPEMVVPYGDPSSFRFFQAYFDSGEFLIGQYVNSLELGCDCLGEISYLDATVADDFGRPRTIKNAICVHEEDFGVMWKHSDIFNHSSEVRRLRRLVISFFTTVGNYDYGFYWYLYLDGTIELEVKLTGVIFTSGLAQSGNPYVAQVAPGLGAPVHQHLFNARLHMAVDGSPNALDEVDFEAPPQGPANPYGNAILRRVKPLKRESEFPRSAAPERGRTWRVRSTQATNAVGLPTSYVLHPQVGPVLLAAPGSSIASRAGFARGHLWATAYDPAERYPAGDFVNQHPGGAGLPQYVARDRDLDGADLVLWHTFGPTHFPRLEDWPVMPVERCGFSLKPNGFFDHNPTLDVAPDLGHCHAFGQPGAVMREMHD